MKNSIITLALTFSFFSLKAQKKQELYFLLNKGAYDKSMVVKKTTLKTTRTDSIYSFTLPCDCNKQGSLNFFRATNPETAKMNLPIRKLKNNEIKVIKLISFEKLIHIMKVNDSTFNNKYNLYFVESDERGEVYTLYHVFKMTLFSDDLSDYIEH